MKERWMQEMTVFWTNLPAQRNEILSDEQHPIFALSCKGQWGWWWDYRKFI